LRWLEKMARRCALLAGVLLTLITLITCASVVGRNLFDISIVGDFELTGLLCGAAIANFMPWCQVSRANIIVDFFTAQAPARTNAALDRIGALLLALVMALLAWRTVVGGWHAWGNHSSSMLLEFPDWLVYFSMVPALMLTACIALWQSLGWDSPESNMDEAMHAPGEGFVL
jgi:TRAP-type C4-dicarboxylate transport system permease small subunit